MVHIYAQRSSSAGPACGRTGRRWALGGALIVGLVLAGGSLAQAQPAGEVEALQREIENTDQILQRAVELAREASAVAAIDHLKQANELQGRARSEYRQGLDAGSPGTRAARFKRALEYTLKARHEALQAMDLARVEKKTQESVRRLIDQAESRAHEVAPVVRESGNEQAGQVLGQAIDHLQRARRAERDRQYAQASRLATLATSLLDRALQLAQADVGAAAGAQVSIDRTAALLAQVEGTLIEQGKRPGDWPPYREARRLLDQAIELFRGGQLRQALQLSLTARQKALQVLADLRQDPQKQSLIEAIEELQALYGELGPEIEAAGGEAEQRMLDEGRRLLRRARALLRDEKPRQALQHLLAAERLLKRAAKAAGL